MSEVRKVPQWQPDRIGIEIEIDSKKKDHVIDTYTLCTYNNIVGSYRPMHLVVAGGGPNVAVK